jgi:hypothetical protein
MAKLIVPVALAGGHGTCLWPMPRAARPKQFLAHAKSESPYQQTWRRVADHIIRIEDEFGRPQGSLAVAELLVSCLAWLLCIGGTDKHHSFCNLN